MKICGELHDEKQAVQQPI